jgi:hypothetical protein
MMYRSIFEVVLINIRVQQNFVLTFRCCESHQHTHKHKQVDLQNYSREKITSYVRNVSTAKREELLSATEAHHYHSFRPKDCTVEKIKRLYNKNPGIMECLDFGYLLVF